MSRAVETASLPPFKVLKQKPPKITVTRQDDGTVYVASDYPLGEMKRSTADCTRAGPDDAADDLVEQFDCAWRDDARRNEGGGACGACVGALFGDE